MLALAVGWVSLRAQAQEASCEERRARVQSLLREGAHEEAIWLSMGLAEEVACADRDQLLSDLALAARGAHRLGTAFRARQMLLDEHPASPLVAPTLFFQAADYRAVGMYEEAARYYVQFADRFPAEVGTDCASEARAEGDCPDARVALETAIELQLALGEIEAARATAASFALRYARAAPAHTADILFAMGQRLEDPEAIVTDAEAFLATHGEVATLDQRARTLVALARAQRARGRVRLARAALRRAIALFTSEALGRSTSEALAQVAIEEAVTQQRAREAHAEAYFLMAELDASELPAVRPPPRLFGPHTEAAIRAWASGPLASWRDRELSQLASLEAAYGRVLARDIPTWRIAALEASAQLWLRILETARMTAPPPWVQAHSAQLDVLELARAQSLEPVAVRARAAFDECVQEGRTTRLFGEAYVRCVRGLESLAGSEPASPQELHAEPALEVNLMAPPSPIAARLHPER